MHQQLKLSEHLKFEKKELQHLTCEIRDLEMKLDRRQLQLRAKQAGLLLSSTHILERTLRLRRRRRYCGINFLLSQL